MCWIVLITCPVRSITCLFNGISWPIFVCQRTSVSPEIGDIPLHHHDFKRTTYVFRHYFFRGFSHVFPTCSDNFYTRFAPHSYVWEYEEYNFYFRRGRMKNQHHSHGQPRDLVGIDVPFWGF